MKRDSADVLPLTLKLILRSNAVRCRYVGRFCVFLCSFKLYTSDYFVHLIGLAASVAIATSHKPTFGLEEHIKNNLGST